MTAPMPPSQDERVRAAFARRRLQVESRIDPVAGLARIRRRDSMPRRILTAATALAATLLVVAGGVAMLTGVEPDVVGDTSLPPPTTLAPAPSTTVPPPTTDVPPVPVVGDWTDSRYWSTAPAELLAEPAGAVLAALPAGELVTLTGQASGADGRVWWRVVLADQTGGWLDRTTLAPPSAWNVDLADLPCDPDGPIYDQAQTVLPSSIGELDGPPPVGVLDVLHDQDAECERFVVVLGLGEGSGPDGAWDDRPGSWVPEGTTVEVTGSVVSITVPGVAYVRPTTDTIQLGDVLALATRNLSGDVTMRLFFDAARRPAVQILENPARVVVDVRPGPTGTGLDLAARAGGSFVVLPIQPSTDPLSLPITVSGWGRPDEATGIAELRTADGQPGAGSPVEATFTSNASGTIRASTYPVSTADWLVWGEFSFTIEDLAPGTYELFIGERSGPDGSPVGVYQTFSVTG